MQIYFAILMKFQWYFFLNAIFTFERLCSQWTDIQTIENKNLQFINMKSDNITIYPSK